jgi:hypothetical protein
MTLKVLYEVPRETGDPEATLYREEVIRLQYYLNDERRRSGIRFHGVGVALARYRLFVPSWLDEAYYALAEVENSAWLKEMLKDVEPKDLPGMRQKRHYAFLTKDSGAFEFIADSWELLPEEPGWWPD